MIKNTLRHRFFRTLNGLTYFAVVTLAATRDDALDAHIIEETYENAEWASGAIKGLEFALLSITGKWRVRVLKIEGTLVDTNPTIVAYAAVRAFWECSGYTPPDTELVRLENIVLASWHHENKHKIALSFVEQTI